MKLLIIEDEISLQQSISDFFRKESFLCDTASNYSDACLKLNFFSYDCIILDINLPGGSGLQLLRYLREQKKADGVVIISARDSLQDRIDGLGLGADDYLTKPFHLSELSARVKALIRRKIAGGSNQMELNELLIDLVANQVSYAGQPISLTRLEYHLLLYLAHNKSRVVSRQAIAEHLSGDDADQLDSFDFVYSHIRNLKKKLKEAGCPDCIRAVYGFGYKFELS